MQLSEHFSSLFDGEEWIEGGGGGGGGVQSFFCLWKRHQYDVTNVLDIFFY